MQQQFSALPLLTKEIMDTKVAIFKCEINSVLSLPNNIIQTLKVDEQGHVYFFTYANEYYAKQINKPFYACLEYHKKNSENILQVTGKAEILIDENEETLAKKNTFLLTPEKTLVLIKLKIMQAEFIGNFSTSNLSITQKIKSTINHLFSNNNSLKFNFNRQ